MAKYNVLVKLDQIVTKEIAINISASSEEEAMRRATEALGEYPAPVTVQGVERVVTNKATYWIPKSIEFVKVTEEKRSA